MLELAQACIRVTGSSSEIVFEALPMDDPMVRRPDITRARQILGWEPEIDLDEGLGAGSRLSATSPSRADPKKGPERPPLDAPGTPHRGVHSSGLEPLRVISRRP